MSETITDRIYNITNSKYYTYVTEINNLCIDAANKGNVFLILTIDDLERVGFTVEPNNSKMLKIYLQEEGFVVTINDLSIEIYWIDLVTQRKFGQKVGEKFPPIQDNEMKNKLIYNDTLTYHNEKKGGKEDHLNDIENSYLFGNNIVSIFTSEEEEEEAIKVEKMGEEVVEAIEVIEDDIYTENILNKLNRLNFSREDKENILWEICNKILQVESMHPEANNFIFKNIDTLNNLISYLNDIDGNISWPSEMLVDFHQIMERRFSKIPPRLQVNNEVSSEVSEDPIDNNNEYDKYCKNVRNVIKMIDEDHNYMEYLEKLCNIILLNELKNPAKNDYLFRTNLYIYEKLCNILNKIDTIWSDNLKICINKIQSRI